MHLLVQGRVLFNAWLDWPAVKTICNGQSSLAGLAAQTQIISAPSLRFYIALQEEITTVALLHAPGLILMQAEREELDELLQSLLQLGRRPALKRFNIEHEQVRHHCVVSGLKVRVEFAAVLVLGSWATALPLSACREASAVGSLA